MYRVSRQLLRLHAACVRQSTWIEIERERESYLRAEGSRKRQHGNFARVGCSETLDAVRLSAPLRRRQRTRPPDLSAEARVGCDETLLVAIRSIDRTLRSRQRADAD